MCVTNMSKLGHLVEILQYNVLCFIFEIIDFRLQIEIEELEIETSTSSLLSSLIS